MAVDSDLNTQASKEPEKGWLERVDVVLSRPEGALNVGAVCRAMKTMGLRHLAIVGANNLDKNDVFKMALNARDLYEEAIIFSSLQEALSDCAISAAITRRRGVKRKWFSLLPEELAEHSASTHNGRTALVFGNERTGLTDEELNHCHLACHIPTDPIFPSLNLSHSVQLISSAFYRHAISEKTGSYRPINSYNLDRLVNLIHDSLEAMNYFKTVERFHTDRYFRDIFSRARLSEREAAQMEKIFRKLHYLSDKD